ncbi:hypothetical protein [Breoghania corrubedonensis]|nr:hypothetical protein [Breoghania corrubedonensis]
MDGFTKGANLRHQWDDRKDRKAAQAEDRAYQRTRRERQETLDARSDDEYERKKKERDAIREVGLGAKREFDEKVKAGELKEGDFGTFWDENVIPRLAKPYLEAGDMEGARRVREWGESAAAKRGGQYALKAMTLAQQGKLGEALTAAQKAAEVRGYLNHGFSFGKQEPIQDQDGNVLGYRVHMTDADGKETTQDVSVGQIPAMLGTFINPEAAFNTQIAAQTANAKTEHDIATYKRKKEIDRSYADPQKARSSAVNALRKRFDGTMDDQIFDDMPAAKQEELIKRYMETEMGRPVGLAGGAEKPAIAQPSAPQPTAASAGRSVVVDKATGQPVEMTTSAPAAPTAPSRAFAGAGGQSTAQPVGQQQEEPQEASTEQEAPAQAPVGGSGQVNGVQVDDLLTRATRALNAGIDPRVIAGQLNRVGIPRSLWPAKLQTGAYGDVTRVSPGLGG